MIAAAEVVVATVVILLGSPGWADQSNFNLTWYRQMPDMFPMDDYDLCLQETHTPLLAHSTYCLVYAEIISNSSSALWHQIERISMDGKHNFRHDHLFIGICLERCKRKLLTLSKWQLQQLYAGKVEDTELSEYYARVHKRDSDERLHHDHLVNRCLNLHYNRQLQLRVRTSIEYCERGDDHLSLDDWDVMFFVMLVLVLALNVISSIYDCRLRLQQPMGKQRDSFYQKPLLYPGQKWCTAFSICRNYHRLVSKRNENESHDFRFFDAFRCIGVFCVILGHTLTIFLTVPVQNPEFFEQYFPRFTTSILQNGNTVIQIFFIMSAFLLYVNLTDRRLITSDSSIWQCIVAYMRVFAHRYFRLVPSLFMLVLFNASILTRLQDGPFWRHITEAERVFCREQWWKNFLFVNNYLLKDSCAPQTWYLGADMQLFELFLIIFIVTTKYPWLKRILNVILGILSFAVPALLTYILKLEAVYHIRPETYRYLYFRNSETFYQIYLPFYTNLCGYFIGFLCGDTYLRQHSSGRSDSYRSQWKMQIVFWLLVPIAMGILFSGYIFIKNDFSKPSIWLALYAGLYKMLWIFVCAGFVLLMCFKVGWIGYEFCILPLFRPLARISFQAFLWHVVVIRLIAGYYRQPVYVNSLFMMCNVCAVLVLTLLIAFVAALLFEYPLVAITKLCLAQATGNKLSQSTEDRPHIDLAMVTSSRS